MNRSLLLAAITSLFATQAAALDPSEVFAKVAPSVFAVRGLDASERPITYGSGVVIGHGRLVTNCHVLAKAKGIQVRRSNHAYFGKLEHADVERDLCIISIAEFDAPAVAMVPPASVRIGQRAYAVGNPERLDLTLSEGLISGLRAEDPSWPSIQTTAPVSPGSSGGGLFDDQGRLIGITTLVVVGRAKIAQNLNFAAPAEWIAEVPERAKQQLAKRSTPPAGPATQKTSIDGQAAQSWTYRLTGRDVKASTQEIRIASISAQQIVEESFVPDGTSRRETHTQGAYMVSVGGLSLFSPYLSAFSTVVPGMRFPEVENRDFRLCGAGWACSTTARVMDTERIKVAAGEFDAVRVHVEQTWISVSQTNDRGETGGRTLDVWYAPELKRAVKFSSRGEPSRYIDTNFDLELDAFTGRP